MLDTLESTQWAPRDPCRDLRGKRTFHGDLLQHMEKNTKLDMQFIKVSLATHPGPPAHLQQACLSPFDR